MLNSYISDWFSIIEGMNNDNTYKLAWGRAILECIAFNKYEKKENETIIQFDDISNCILKYYWNQTFFFNLKQSPYSNNPRLCKNVEKLIDEYKRTTNSNIPIWYDEAIEVIDKAFLQNIIKQSSKILHENVCWRFLRLNRSELKVYEYDKKKGSLITFTNDKIDLLKDYGIILAKLLNFKWAQLLEKYNCAPKIANKVNGISEAKLKRNDLSKYKNELLKEFENGKILDFYSGEELDINNISIDHVIPWSFMYSDDIWNLVITSKSYNSSKSNSIPNENVIEKLANRNKKLINILDGKYKDDLKIALENNYLEKYYYECRL